MSIEDISDRISAALEMIDDARAALNQAAEQLGDSATILRETFEGSTSYEAERTLGLLDQAQRELRDQVATLAAAAQATRDVRARLVGTGPVAGAPTRTGSPTGGGRPGQRTPPSPHGQGNIAADRVEQLRDELPPPVVPNTGQRTHGLDDKAQETTRMFEEDLKFGLVPSVVTHVEMKVAAHMRKNGIRAVTLVINHIPCIGRLSCRKLLPRVLPSGYTLTVYGPDGYHDEYRGSE